MVETDDEQRGAGLEIRTGGGERLFHVDAATVVDHRWKGQAYDERRWVAARFLVCVAQQGDPITDLLRSDANWRPTVAKTGDAVSRTGLDQLVVAGGVGANSRLRTELAHKAAAEGFEVFYPPLDLCTDNVFCRWAMRCRCTLKKQHAWGRAFGLFADWDEGACIY